ncbi:c-type cytochrome [Luteolibacter flavescens]|uniref:C-type cytochrome n=1 Tax=Luteolibacter flavescens TaxID=1859460 RepID=A0ABT3FUG4_9BACT|nr:PVC-type heme-binding CxxCH protein [Luteolibacter flavescens]MCW1887225.1 c-type cytochrome [Luteolibacter flavescens]
MKARVFAIAAVLLSSPLHAAPLFKEPQKNERIVMLGNGLGERMQYYGGFEMQLLLRFPEQDLTLRNMCYPGDTPAYRPRAGRSTPWAFPGGEALRPELNQHKGEGHYPSEDEWLAICKADTILAFFGYNESFDGPEGVEKYRKELTAFVTHTLAQKYNGKSAPKLVLVSPIAFEDLTRFFDLPDGTKENENLARYTQVMAEVAKDQKVGFIDLFTATKKAYAETKQPFTMNGFSLNEYGDSQIGDILAGELYEPKAILLESNPSEVLRLVKEKSWFWQNDHRMLNGVHAYGRRFQPYGDFNYPQEVEKIRGMTVNRDQAIWAALRGKTTDLKAADEKTRPLDEVKTNFDRPIQYLREKKALESFKMMDGFEISVFASEEDFPDLANPMQMTFDNRGRLWVCTMPSYPHYRPGDEMPNDKILILEDTDGDNRADKQTVFADGLHLPIGIELAPEGVYVSQEPNLMLLRDINGDDKADQREYILHGFDPHDTHHAIHAFSTDSAGAIYMGEGVFLHSQVETPYGPQRCTGGGIWRFDPKTWRLDRYVQTYFNNPWGIAFDDWQQCFIADASGGNNYWGLPISIKAPFSYETGKIGEFAPKRARPTAGAEFISSRHFPDELQGGFMTNNSIGFLGTSIHQVWEDRGGFSGKHLGDLVTSSDPNFRPCDLEFAPDGSLYIVDWHNALIGHMQHSARDPKRDKEHGRIYRITHKTRPLVKPANIVDSSVAGLFNLLKEPEYRTRYRTRRELRGHPADVVTAAAKAWITTLDKSDARYEHHLCEALWATWAQNQVDREILGLCLGAKAHQARAAAVEVVRHAWRKIPDHKDILMKAAADPEPLVRLQALAAASWLDNTDGALIALEVMKHPIEKWMPEAVKTAFLTLGDDIETLKKDGKLDLSANPQAADYLSGKLKLQPEEATAAPAEPKLPADELELWRLGKEVFAREAHCATCHQADGKGQEKIYPPLDGSEWVTGNEERLIKLTLKGLYGPITVKGTKFDPTTGVPPMMGFGPLLNDKEVAGVLTYVRNSFGNQAPAVKPETVAKIREATKEKIDFYTPDELLKDHP